MIKYYKTNVYIYKIDFDSNLYTVFCINTMQIINPRILPDYANHDWLIENRFIEISKLEWDMYQEL